MNSVWYEQVGLLAAFGGGLLTAIILNVPIPLFSSNTLGITWTICWWLANYSPGNIVGKILALAPVRIPAKVGPIFAMQNIPFLSNYSRPICWWLAMSSLGNIVGKVLALTPVLIPAKVRHTFANDAVMQWHMSESSHHHTLRLSGLH